MGSIDEAERASACGSCDDTDARRTLRDLNAVLDSIEYGVLFMDRDLNVRLTNRAYRQIWGLPDHVFESGPLTLMQLYELTRPQYDVHDHEAHSGPSMQPARRKRKNDDMFSWL